MSQVSKGSWSESLIMGPLEFRRVGTWDRGHRCSRGGSGHRGTCWSLPPTAQTLSTSANASHPTGILLLRETVSKKIKVGSFV